MSVIDKIDQFISEEVYNPSGWEKGKWIVQNRGRDNEFGILIDKLKNGSWSVVSKSDETAGGKAKKGSTNGWYPEPKLIDVKNVPPKIKDKVMQKLGQLGIKL